MAVGFAVKGCIIGKCLLVESLVVWEEGQYGSIECHSFCFRIDHVQSIRRRGRSVAGWLSLQVQICHWIICAEIAVAVSTFCRVRVRSARFIRCNFIGGLKERVCQRLGGSERVGRSKFCCNTQGKIVERSAVRVVVLGFVHFVGGMLVLGGGVWLGAFWNVYFGNGGCKDQRGSQRVKFVGNFL